MEGGWAGVDLREPEQWVLDQEVVDGKVDGGMMEMAVTMVVGVDRTTRAIGRHDLLGSGYSRREGAVMGEGRR